MTRRCTPSTAESSLYEHAIDLNDEAAIVASDSFGAVIRPEDVRISGHPDRDIRVASRDPEAPTKTVYRVIGEGRVIGEADSALEAQELDKSLLLPAARGEGSRVLRIEPLEVALEGAPFTTVSRMPLPKRITLSVDITFTRPTLGSTIIGWVVAYDRCGSVLDSIRVGV